MNSLSFASTQNITMKIYIVVLFIAIFDYCCASPIDVVRIKIACFNIFLRCKKPEEKRLHCLLISMFKQILEVMRLKINTKLLTESICAVFISGVGKIVCYFFLGTREVL